MGSRQGPGGGAAAEPASKCGPTLHRGMKSVWKVWETGLGAGISSAEVSSSKEVQAGVPPVVVVVVAISLLLLPGCPTMLLC